MRIRILPLSMIAVVGLAGVLLLFPAAAHADSFTKTFGGPTGFGASITFTWTSGATATISATNTTKLGASSANAGSSANCGAGFTGTITSTLDSACRLLTTFGWASGAIAQSIIGGSATIASGSSGFGDGTGGPTFGPGTNWSREWGYANNNPPDGIGTFDFLSGNSSFVTVFDPTADNVDGPTNVDGPQAGLLSSIFTDAGGLGYVKNTLDFSVTFSSSLNTAAFNALKDAKWFVEFGSSGWFLTKNGNGTTEEASEPGLLIMFGIGLAGAFTVGRIRKREDA